MHSNIIRILE